MPRPRTLAEQFPRPFDIEPKSDYLLRSANHPTVRGNYTAARARIAAEREWAAAKARSLVCITALGDQFLMFGELESI